MKPVILPVFLPHLGCPHRCLYCNQKAFVTSPLPPEHVKELIETFLRRHPPRFEGRQRQVAFYGGSFTAIGKEDQLAYLRVAQPYLASGQIESIRLSTRPDALDEETLNHLEEFGVKTVEVGVQSMSERVLVLTGRGHTVRDSIDAVLRLKERGFEVGVHLMAGLPGETREEFLDSLDRVIELKPDFVRIHPTLVLRGSPLEALWREGAYRPLSLNEAIDWLKLAALKFKKVGVPLARMGLQPSRELEEHLLAGPYHPALHQIVESAIFYDRCEHLLRHYGEGPSPVLLCHPKDLSNLKGQMGENLRRLKERFNLDHLSIAPREDCGRGRVGLLLSGGEIWTETASSA